jgi:flavodoxin
MKTLVVYNGRFGNTEQAAETIKAAIGSHSDEVIIRRKRGIAHYLDHT